MIELAMVLLTSPGPKGFFENPAYLIGLPLVILGAAGILLALSPVELRWPAPSAAAEAVQLPPGAEGHPSPSQYVMVGMILALVTLLEVGVYYADALKGALLGILMVLSGTKFVMVALWFMHLRFDSRIFSLLFAGGLILVAALFFVVLSSLGASLV